MKKIFENKKILIGIIAGLVALVAVVLIIVSMGKKYTVSFDTDGGTKLLNIVVKSGETVKLPEDPTKEGYKFNGWLLNGSKFDDTIKVKKNIVLKADWLKEGAETITITFDTDGGTNVAPIVIEKGTEVKLPVKVEKIGYILKEWVDTDNRVIKEGTILKEDTLLKAVWEEKEKPTTTEPSTTTKKPTTTTKKTTTTTKKTTTTTKKITTTKVDVQGLTFDETDITMIVNSTKKLEVNILPSNATNKNLTWSSSDKSVVKVDSNGNVKTVGIGSAIITVKSDNGKKAIVTVNSEVKNLEIIASRNAISYFGVKEVELTANVDMNGLSDINSQLIQWYSADTSGQNAASSLSGYNGKTIKLIARTSGISGGARVTLKVGNKEVSRNFSIEGKLSAYPDSSNQMNCGTLDSENNISCRFSSNADEEVLSIFTAVPIKNWSISSLNFATVINKESKNIKLKVRRKSQNGFNVKAESEGGQKFSIVVNTY